MIAPQVRHSDLFRYIRTESSTKYVTYSTNWHSLHLPWRDIHNNKLFLVNSLRQAQSPLRHAPLFITHCGVFRANIPNSKKRSRCLSVLIFVNASARLSIVNTQPISSISRLSYPSCTTVVSIISLLSGVRRDQTILHWTKKWCQ